jgi:hypothetical protein
MRAYLAIILGYCRDSYDFIIDGSLTILLEDEVVMIKYGSR